MCEYIHTSRERSNRKKVPEIAVNRRSCDRTFLTLKLSKIEGDGFSFVLFLLVIYWFLVREVSRGALFVYMQAHRHTVHASYYNRPSLVLQFYSVLTASWSFGSLNYFFFVLIWSLFTSNCLRDYKYCAKINKF